MLLPTHLAHGQVAATDWVTAAKAAHWQIDASQLAQFDSSVLALLLDVGRAAGAQQATLRIHNAPPRLIQLATLYGVQGMIGTSSATTTQPSPA